MLEWCKIPDSPFDISGDFICHCYWSMLMDSIKCVQIYDSVVSYSRLLDFASYISRHFELFCRQGGFIQLCNYYQTNIRKYGKNPFASYWDTVISKLTGPNFDRLVLECLPAEKVFVTSDGLEWAGPIGLGGVPIELVLKNMRCVKSKIKITFLEAEEEKV